MVQDGSVVASTGSESLAEFRSVVDCALVVKVAGSALPLGSSSWAASLALGDSVVSTSDSAPVT